MTDNNRLSMKRIFGIAAVAFAVILTGSCEKYEDGRPEKSVRNEFSQMYPDAKDIEWDREHSWWTVSFETGTAPNRTEHEAWYDLNGQWIRTETDMRLSAVPERIMGFLSASEYGSASFEDNDAEFIQTPSGNYYRFDLLHSGVDIYIDVSEAGKVTLAKFDW